LDLGMDAFLLDVIVVAAAGLCLVALSFCLRLLTWREPRPARAAKRSPALPAQPQTS
jgi:hypothetical protein